MFLKKIKNIVITIDSKLFKSSIINTYIKLKYFFEIKRVYASIEKINIKKKRKHTLSKELLISLTSYSKRFRTLPLVLYSSKIKLFYLIRLRFG